MINKDEAMSHVICSARYWAGDTLDNAYYSNNSGIEKAFERAVKHVTESHGFNFNDSDIEELKGVLKIK